MSFRKLASRSTRLLPVPETPRELRPSSQKVCVSQLLLRLAVVVRMVQPQASAQTQNAFLAVAPVSLWKSRRL